MGPGDRSQNVTGRPPRDARGHELGPAPGTSGPGPPCADAVLTSAKTVGAHRQPERRRLPKLPIGRRRLGAVELQGGTHVRNHHHRSRGGGSSPSGQATGSGRSLKSVLIWSAVAVGRRGLLDGARPGPRRDRLGAVDAVRRAVLLRDRLPLLLAVHHLQGAAGRRQAGHPGRAAARTASTSTSPTGGCSSATTSPPSPAPARWSARCSPPRWATCPARSGSSSASSSPGAVQDLTVMFFSMRRNGKSLGQMVREEIGIVGGIAALIAVFAIMIIILAVLALIVVNALAESPWGVFSIALTIPIALFMGVYLRRLRPGRVLEATGIGVALLLLAIVGGGWIEDTGLGDALTLSKEWLVLALVDLRLRRLGAAGLAAAHPARLPVDVHEDRRDRPAGDQPDRSPGRCCRPRRSPTSPGRAPARSSPARCSRSSSSPSPAGRCPASTR